MTIQEALEGWFLHLRAKNASPGTIERYARVWRRFTVYLAEHDLTEVDQLRGEHAKLFTLQRMGQVSEITAHYEVTP